MKIKSNKIIVFLILTILFFQNSKITYAISIEGEWKPQIVEKMYVLPPKQLNRVLENDFKSSSLAATLNKKDIKIRDRQSKINKLNEAILSFDGEEKIELQHQIIIEKKDYIKDMHQLLKMKKKELNTKKQFFKKIENKLIVKNTLGKSNNSIENERNKIIERTTQLDEKIFDNILISNSKKSKYLNAYSKNKRAIDSLRKAIKKHPMSQLTSQLMPDNKIQSIKNLVENIETEVSIIELKEELLNYMAKLVALDAMQLAENLSDSNEFINNQSIYNDPNDVIEFFIN